MPYVYMNPETFVTVGDEFVCHCYHPRNPGQVRNFWYQILSDEHSGWTEFDIRDAAYHAGGSLGLDLSTPESHAEVIRRAFAFAEERGVSFVEWLRNCSIAYTGEG